jgi:hypothetical protein
MQAYINKFLRWFLVKTGRTCEHCCLYEHENNKCQIFNCCYFPTDFCMRWIRKDD